MPRVAHPSWHSPEALEPRQLLAFVLWDGGGGDTDWDNPLNWSGDALPGAADHVLIDAPGSQTINRSHNTAATIASLWTLDALNISDGTLTITGEWKQSAALFMSGGRVAGNGNVLINGEALWIGGEILGGGNILVYPGRQLTIGGDVTLGKNLYNNGELRWSAGNLITDGGTIQNLSGRTFTILSTGTLSTTGPTTTLINYGTLNREGPGQSTIAVRFSNYPSQTLFGFPPFPPPLPPGTVDVRDGTLAITGTLVEKTGDAMYGAANWYVSSSTARLLLPGPNLRIATGTFLLSGVNASFPQLEEAQSIGYLTLANGRAFTFSNAAAGLTQLTIDSPGYSLTLPGLTIPGLTINGGNVTINGMSGDSVFVDADASLTLRGPSQFSYAQVSGPGLIRLEGSLHWRGGEIAGPGQLLITQTGSITSGAQYWEIGFKKLSRRTINYGTITISQGIFLGGESFALSAELVNRGTLNLQVSGYISTAIPGTPGVINNFGLLTSTGVLTFRGASGGVRLINHFNVQVQSGSLILNGGASGGGNWVVESGAELAFGGLGSVLQSPVFTGIGRIRQAAAAYWSNATVSGSGDMVNTAPGRLTLSGATSITRLSFSNDGKVFLGSGATANVNANFYNNAELNLGTAVLNVGGDFNSGPNAVLTSRHTSAADPARLNITGNAHLAGTLSVLFTWPATSGLYNFMTVGSRSNAFNSTIGLGLPPNTFMLLDFIGNAGKLHLATL